MSAPDPQTEPVQFYRYAVERQARGLGVLRRVPQERYVEMLRLWLLEGLTLREIGKRSGVSATRVRQILGEYFGVAAARFRAHGGLIVTAPAPFVPVLREAAVEGLAAAAGKIEDEGHAHPRKGIAPGLLEAFDAYRALLEAVGTVPEVAVQVNVSTHGWALETALREHLRLQRAFMADADGSGDITQYRRARRDAGMIEAFIADAGLRGEET